MPARAPPPSIWSNLTTMSVMGGGGLLINFCFAFWFSKRGGTPENPTKSPYSSGKRFRNLTKSISKSHKIPRNLTKSREILRNPAKSYEIPRSLTRFIKDFVTFRNLEITKSQNLDNFEQSTYLVISRTLRNRSQDFEIKAF